MKQIVVNVTVFYTVFEVLYIRKDICMVVCSIIYYVSLNQCQCRPVFSLSFISMLVQTKY